MYSKQDSFPPLSTFKGGLAQHNKVSPNGTFNEIDLMHLKVIEQKGASTPLPKDPTGHLSFTTYHVSTSPISSVSSSPGLRDVSRKNQFLPGTIRPGRFAQKIERDGSRKKNWDDSLKIKFRGRFTHFCIYIYI